MNHGCQLFTDLIQLFVQKSAFPVRAGWIEILTIQIGCHLTDNLRISGCCSGMVQIDHNGFLQI